MTETPSESQPTAERGEQLRCLRELRIFSRHLLVLGCFRAEGGGGVLRRVRGCRGAAEFGPRRSPPARACRCPSTPETSADPGDQERQHLCQTSLPPQQEGACGRRWGGRGEGFFGGKNDEIIGYSCEALIIVFSPRPPCLISKLNAFTILFYSEPQIWRI